MLTIRNATRANEKGFTLIEMAIVIMIIGILIASFTPLFTAYQRTQKMEATTSNINVTASAIGSFRSMFGRYPCPASMTADRDSPNYGREDCTNIWTTAPGSCYTPDADTRICVEQSTRVLASYDYPVATPRVNTAPRVLVGALPFRHLNMDEKDAVDGYGRPMMYVVTEHLTCADCFQADQGGISIVDQAGTTAITPAASGHFLVLSFGENGDGATMTGGAQIPCPLAGIENENCDYVAQPDATYAISETNTSNTNARYDDSMTYFTQEEVPLWQMSTVTPDAIKQKATGSVAVGASAGITQTGEVVGIVRAQDDEDVPSAIIKTLGVEDGEVQALAFRTSTAGQQFFTERIAGTIDVGGPEDPADSDIQCGPGRFLKGIMNGQEVCGDEVQIRCPANRPLRGINANGTLNCGPSTCPAQNVSLCSTTFSLPAAMSGDPAITINAGASRQRIYQCLNGTWTVLSTTGSCTCTPGSTTSNVACDPGFSGQQQVTVTTVCPAGTTTTTVDTSACVCQNITQTVPLNCPAGLTNNNYQQTRTHVCAGPGAPYWTNWVISGSCDCNPQPPQNQTIQCAGNLTGTRIQERVFQCPAGTWSDWADIDVSGCSCVEQTVPATVSCPPGYTGNINYSNHLSCPAATWDGWVYVSDDCAPEPPQKYYWNNVDSGTVQTVPIGPPEGSECPTAGAESPVGCHLSLGGGQYRNYTSCICGGS